MKLTYKIIESLVKTLKPLRFDWDDCGFEVILPCGIILVGHTMINNRKVESDSLEGMDGFIYIRTKEELELLISMTRDEVFNWIKEKNPDFDINEIENEY
jgi:hypothetical protein